VSKRDKTPDDRDERVDRGMEIAFAPSAHAPDETLLAAIERLSGASSRVMLPDPDAMPPHAKTDCEETLSGERRYQILAEIARGDTAVVFEGRDESLGRTVALKVLGSDHAADDRAIDRFLGEAQLAGQLQHPGIVPIYGLGLADDSRPYIAMKLVRGATLSSLLGRRRAPEEDRRRFLGIFEQISQTLAYAHARGVAHLDLKPANVLVGDFGEVYVVDWGRARITGRSPDQAEGTRESLDERTDVFALGVILCEILTGEPLPEAPSHRLAAIHERLDACEGDGELAGLALRCLAGSREERPRNAREVAEAVSRHLAEMEEAARRAELRAAEERSRAEQEHGVERLERRKARWEGRARRRTAALAAIVLFASLLGGVAYLLKERAARSRVDRTAAAVAGALSKAAFHESAAEWERATEWGRTAVALAHAGDADSEISKRAADCLAGAEEKWLAAQAAGRRAAEDSGLLASLEGLRVRRGVHGVDPVALEAEFERLFREFGIDVTDPEAAAAALRLRSEVVEIAAALDEWAVLRRKRRLEGADWIRLVDIARSCDPDEWRNRFRSANTYMDRVELRTLAATADAAKLPSLTLRLLSHYLLQVGETRTAASLLRDAQHHHPGDFWINYELGVVLRTLGRRKHAIQYLTAALAVRPDLACLWSDLGGLLQKQGDLDRALEAHRRAIRCVPDHAEHHDALGQTLLARGDSNAAVAAFREALEMEPDTARTHANLASALWQQKQFDGARDAYARALELAPGNGGIHAAFAWFLVACGETGVRDPALALEHAERAVALEAEDALGWRSLGVARYRLGRLQAAIKALRRARTLGSGGGPYEWLYLAMAHRRLGRSNRARALFAQVVEWMGQERSPSQGLRRLRAEAEALLEGEGNQGG